MSRRPIFPGGIITSGPTVQPVKLSQLMPIALLKLLRELAGPGKAVWDRL